MGIIQKNKAYISKLYYTISLNGDVPNRVWSGINVPYDYLTVFECKSFMPILKDKRSKIEVKTRQCIFIGFGQDEVGYCLNNAVEKKIIWSHGIIFFKD